MDYMISPPNAEGKFTYEDVITIYSRLLINDLLQTDPEEQAPIRLVRHWAVSLAHVSRLALSAREDAERAQRHEYLQREGFAVIASGFGGRRG